MRHFGPVCGLFSRFSIWHLVDESYKWTFHTTVIFQAKNTRNYTISSKSLSLIYLVNNRINEDVFACSESIFIWDSTQPRLNYIPLLLLFPLFFFHKNGKIRAQTSVAIASDCNRLLPTASIISRLFKCNKTDSKARSLTFDILDIYHEEQFLMCVRITF